MSTRYFVQTFGCQMNMHDTSRMEEALVSHGWEAASGMDAADLIIFNTCSVREKAEQKLRSEVGKLLPLKQQNPELVIAVAGCVAQQEGEKLLSRIAHLDLVIGPDNLAELPALALAQQAGSLPVARTVFDLDAPRFLAAQPVAGKVPVSAFVTTMKGCDERCSFCVVPYTRGPERYRPAKEVVAEVVRWVEAGAREVVLLGQTVDSYQDGSLLRDAAGGDMASAVVDPDETQFPQLLRLIAERAPGLARLRYTSPHPRHATASLARAHADLDVLAKHIHLPVQSGSDRMLRRMIRRYTRAEYVARAQRLKDARPGLTMSTDIIVGFPGETREDFEATLSLVREVGFVSLFGFAFSPRPLTPALKLADDVPAEEKSARLAELFALAEEQGGAHLRSLVGSTQQVLIEGPSKAASDLPRFSGRTERNEIVHVAGVPGFVLTGRILEVTITRAFRHSLEAELTPEARASLRPAPALATSPRRSLSLL